MSIRVVTVVGARPQFIKAAAVSRAIRESYARTIDEIIVHTGQHYDANMSTVFFDELGIPQPQFNLGITHALHGAMTGKMLEGIETVLLNEKPDRVLVYGDTNSTLAGALAAAKLHIPVAHVEAGLRSFNMKMPEEVNRILTDRVADLLFCPTTTAVTNLENEGVTAGVFNTGDVMFDVALYYRDRARSESRIMQNLGLADKQYFLATCHRAENTDDPGRLREILAALAELAQDRPVVLPLHPRTRKLAYEHGLSDYLSALRVLEPLSFLDMVALEQSARLILTDSGGVQKEAFFYNVPCVTLRDETEWVETVESGRNILAGPSKSFIISAVSGSLRQEPGQLPAFAPYGDGNAATGILSQIVNATHH